jgi:hypothetical protein
LLDPRDTTSAVPTTALSPPGRENRLAAGAAAAAMSATVALVIWIALEPAHSSNSRRWRSS